MSKLRGSQRRKLPKNQFGQPNARKYPMPDKAHAANAKARATQEFNKGKLSKGQRDAIHAKANKKLGKAK